MTDTNVTAEIVINSTGAMTSVMAEQSQRALIEAFNTANYWNYWGRSPINFMSHINKRYRSRFLFNELK